jgi:hypothetical protein
MYLGMKKTTIKKSTTKKSKLYLRVCTKCWNSDFVPDVNGIIKCHFCNIEDSIVYCNFCSKSCDFREIKKHEKLCPLRKYEGKFRNTSDHHLVVVVLDTAIFPMLELFLDIFRTLQVYNKWQTGNISFLFPFEESNDVFDLKVFQKKLTYMWSIKEKGDHSFFFLTTNKYTDLEIENIKETVLRFQLRNLEFLKADNPDFIVDLESFFEKNCQ